MLKIAPTTEAEIVDAVREATGGTSFEIVSHGSKRGFGRPVRADAIMDVSAVSGIIKYEPEELVLTARAATPIAEIEAALRAKNQMLGFAPADWGRLFGQAAGRSTLAGIVATNACGARKVKAGAVRDSVIGCRFVNGRGEAIKAGGYVIKNVTGFDLPKLMCGAFGTLGVLSELTFRVSPAPQRVAAIVIRNCAPETGLEALRHAAGLAVDPTGLVFLPAEISEEGSSEGAGIIRVEGTSAAIAEKLDVLRRRFSHHDLATLEDDRTRALFGNIDSSGFLAARETDIWRLCVPSTEAPDALKALDPSLWYADWAGGLLWLGLPGNEETAARLRRLTARLGGHATLMRGSEEARTRLSVFEPEPPARAGLTRAVKAAFDPKRVLNPGRMFEDI